MARLAVRYLTIASRIAAGALSITIGCSSPDPAPLAEASRVLFPVLAPPSSAEEMQALLIGRISLSGQCVRIDQEPGESYVAVWPVGYAFRESNGSFEIVDAGGLVRARSRERVRVSGGEIESLQGVRLAREDLAAAVERNCGGPYWLVGREVR